MLAERRKLSAMRIFSGALVLALTMCASAVSASPPARDVSGQVELEQGLSAYKAGSYGTALPVLKEAAAKGGDTARFFAEFYMARIYADNAGAMTDHAKAFMLFRKLADEHADIDPVDDDRAPFVAKALIALAGYVRTGLKTIDVPPNARRAASYLHHAAIFFGDKEAQFELAKLYLSGDGSPDDVRRGLHYLSALSEQSYPAAQALLAELFWKGRYVRPDERRALALITMAAENAPAHDRIWIEETYHSIYCATPHGTRAEATGMLARWRKVFARPTAQPADVAGLGGRDLQPERQCSNGEAVAIRRAVPLATGTIQTASPSGRANDVVQGSALSFGFRPASGEPPVTGSTK